MALEREDLIALAKPLPVSAHEFLNGLVYLTEEPITERLDEVDPGWQFVIKSITTRSNAGDGGKDVATVTVHASLIIKGVARDGVGMAIVQRTNPMQAKNKAGQVIGEYTSEANEAEKSAATDAFKRAARMFGIGRYILGMGKSVQDERQLVAWLNKNYPAQQSKPAQSPAPAPSNLDPEAHGLMKLDRKLLDELTMPFYDNAPHQKNSINKLLADGVIKMDMATDTAAAYVFRHRAQGKELGFNDTDIENALGMKLGEFLKKYPRQYAKAWQTLHDYANTEMSA
jgi:hypothetical protein